MTYTNHLTNFELRQLMTRMIKRIKKQNPASIKWQKASRLYREAESTLARRNYNSEREIPDLIE